MIRKLTHTDAGVAGEIWRLFQVSYAVEAEILKARDFPPLQRSTADIADGPNTFYGYRSEGRLAGVVEVDAKSQATHIQSLVVDPACFRQGIGGALVQFVLDQYDTPLFTVETGLENGPATALYRAFGFVPVRSWDTDHGVRKIRFELHP